MSTRRHTLAVRLMHPQPLQQPHGLLSAKFVHRQQGKECTDDIKVFSRAIPFEHLGRESDVRVFIARTLAPGEVPPLTVPEVAAAWERKLAKGRRAAEQAAADAAAAKVGMRCFEGVGGAEGARGSQTLPAAGVRGDVRLSEGLNPLGGARSGSGMCVWGG